jgi:hypothetical protein
MRRPIGLIAGVIALLVASPAAFASDETAKTGPKRALTAKEQAEKAVRRACEAKICEVIASGDPVGEDVTCDIVKSWPEEEIVEMLGGRINWPWGGAMCQSKIRLPRMSLVKAMTEASYEVTLPTQKARCELAQDEDGDPFVIEAAAAPKVKFENGKASEAQVNWDEVSSPLTLYPLIYGGTALDNSTNVLGPEMVRLVNEFTRKKCAQMRVELQRGSPN